MQHNLPFPSFSEQEQCTPTRDNVAPCCPDAPKKKRAPRRYNYGSIDAAVGRIFNRARWGGHRLTPDAYPAIKDLAMQFVENTTERVSLSKKRITPEDMGLALPLGTMANLSARNLTNLAIPATKFIRVFRPRRVRDMNKMSLLILRAATEAHIAYILQRAQAIAGERNVVVSSDIYRV